MKRLALLILLGGALSTTTGCGLFQAVFCYRPCMSRCDSGVCQGDCDDGCPTCGAMRPGLAMRRARAYAEDDSCDVGCGRPCRRVGCRTCGSCDPCADPCGDSCYGRCWHRGPLSCLFALFSPRCWCGSACGERYWGDFYSDGPDCWDPCDGNGNYTGGSGCRSCGAKAGYNRTVRGGGQVFDEYDDGQQEEIVSQSERTVPTPASQKPHKAVRQ